jgi:hypothetical protein
MWLVSERQSTPLHTPTFGRFGGLTAVEAERGEHALWLSGDGYRAALFHLGALTRLNELGLLAQVSTVGAVSGGSILAALLAARVPWPLDGAHREWLEQVVRPLRLLARRNARARSILRRPFPGAAAEAALEERYARELLASLGGESRWGPNFIFGASGLALSGLAADWEESVEWQIGAASHPPGYPPALVEETIAAVRTDLDAFGEAEQAVLENHGYLLADAALRRRGLINVAGVEGLPPEPPHPRWMGEEQVREALSVSSQRKPVGRLRPRRARGDRRAPRVGRSSERIAEDLTALLEQHRPMLQYDSLDCLRADDVSTICSLALPNRCNSLHRANGTLIASVEPRHGEARLSLDFLGGSYYADGEQARRGDYLEECGGSQAADALELRRQREGSDVVFGRACRDEDGRLWLQYWLFFYYDDKGLLGLEQHEGDWEVFQVRIGAKGRPDAATFARHSGADCLSWEQLDLVESEGGLVAVVYPARGSHAPLARPGTYAAPAVPDHNDGLGPRVRPRLEAIGEAAAPGWVLWPGYWGSTRRREYFERDSPRGPREHPCWLEPAELHREGRAWSGPVPTAAVLAGAAPPPAQIEARREGDLAVVSYRVQEPQREQREAARIVAAPIDENDEVGAPHSFPVEGQEGSLAIQLPPERDWRGIRACVASDLAAPGETLMIPFTADKGSGRASHRAVTGFAATPGSQSAPRSPTREGQGSRVRGNGRGRSGQQKRDRG